ncbi:protein kinase-like protein [Leishmania infantum JPCM5]|uniref:Protein kinase-like protein n=2 Tax=Leishmania infantum TaxID=5671 RepID=A4I489_LEIIN|nr:protein kinase-like protein [Leishmania infantum JPCM5]CAM69597.2 protein kinase-like protein [Leishmania infantum JPCM5]|eukprot:XP_001466558.2 protein kinase-like protein [Leishmania infantum JPCM5]
MGDSQHSSVHSRYGGGQSSIDVSSLMTVNVAGLRNSGVLSPLVWQTPRPTSSASLTMLGLNRRDVLSTSSLAPWSMTPKAGHQRQQGRGLEHGSVPTPTQSSSSSSQANDAATTAGSPFFAGAASLVASAEWAALITKLGDFYDFVVRLPGFHTDDRTAFSAMSSRGVDGDAEHKSYHSSELPRSPEPPGTLPPSLQQSRDPQRREVLFPDPAEAARQRKTVRSPKSCDASVTHEIVSASAVSVSSEASRRRNNNAGSLERNGKDEESEEDRPSTAPAAGPRRLNSTSRCLSQAPDAEAPPGVTTAFDRYLEQARHMILCADSSEVDRAVALDGLLMRCRELFDLLRDMYTLAHVPGATADRSHLSMVKVLPYDEVSTPSSTSVSSTSSIPPGPALRTQESNSDTKGVPLSSTTQPWNSQLPPLSWRPLTAATAARSKDAFERGRRTSVSSCSSSVACIEVLNNYYVMQLIGVGATGRVYLAVDRHTCKAFAMKTVPRHSRRAVGRRFPLAPMSASDSEALQLEGSMLRAVHIDGAAAHAAGSSTTTNAPLALVRPFSMSVASVRPATRREGTRDSMDVSLCEAALDSLIHVAATSHPSDAAIPFVESVTASSSAMTPGSGDVEAPNTSKKPPPQTSSSKHLNGSSLQICAGGAGLHTTVSRSTNAGESVGGDSVVKSVKSAHSSELPAVEREIRVMRRVCNHPHVAQLKEVIDDDKEDSVHLVMTYAENGPLTVMHGFDAALGCAPCDVVRPFSRCARLLHQLAEALIYVHRQRIVHNDVKPDNILLTEADNILLTDFGESVLISKKLPQMPAAHMSIGAAGGEGLNASVLVPHNRWKSSRGANDSWATLSTADRSPCSSSPAGHTANTSQMMAETSFLPDSSMFLAAGVDVEGRLKGNRSAIGTPAFAAPELIMSSTCSYDSDAWSFGVVLYSVIFGRLPFAAATISETFSEILNSALSFPALEEVPERVGMTETDYHQWVELCTKLLVREPRQRLPLSAVLRHPLFRTPAAVGAKPSTSATGGVEMPRGRRPPSRIHSDLSSAPTLWWPNHSSQASRPVSDKEGSPLMSRAARAAMPPLMSREGAASVSAAANRRCSTEGSKSPLTRGGAVREAVLDRHRLQTMAGSSQASSIFASSGTSMASLSPPAASAGFGRRSKPTVAEAAAPQMWPEIRPLQAARLQCQCAWPNSSPAGRHSFSGASSVHTASFTATGHMGRPREHTLVYKQGFASQSASAIQSPINRSFFSTSTPFKESPPDRVVTPGIQLTSCTDFTSPLPCLLTRAGSSTPDLGTEDHEEDQQDESGKEESRSSNVAGAVIALAAVAAPAPPASPPATSSAGRPRSVAAARGAREDTAAVGPCVQRRCSEEEPCEGDGSSGAGCNFSYWGSSNDVADSGDSEDERRKQEINDKASQLPKPPLRPPSGRSAHSSSAVRPLASLQEVVAQHVKPKGRGEHLKSVAGVPYGDSTIAPGSPDNLSATRELVQKARETESPVQQRASKSSPLSNNLVVNSTACGGSSSPCPSPLKSTSEIPPAQAKKSRFWCHR